MSPIATLHVESVPGYLLSSRSGGPLDHISHSDDTPAMITITPRAAKSNRLPRAVALGGWSGFLSPSPSLISDFTF